MSILNGLHELGQSVAQFAGTVGIDLQRSQLANQAQILADQLATTRETKLQGQQQEFQSKMETGRQGFQSGENAQNRASEMARAQLNESGAMARTQVQAANQVALERMRLSDDPSDVKAARAFRADPTLLDAVTRLNEAKTGVGSVFIQPGAGSQSPPTSTPSTGETSKADTSAPKETLGAGQSASNIATTSPSATPVAPAGSAPEKAGPDSANVGDVLSDPKENKAYSPRAAIVDILKKPNANWNTDILKQISPEYRSRVIAMLEGREAPPPSSRVNPITTRLINAAHMIDPTFDESTWQERFKTRQSIASGPIYQNTLALNTAFGHIAQLGAQFAKEGNYQSPLINKVVNYASESVIGNPAVPDTRRAIDTAASEIRRALSGSQGGLTELQEWQKNFPLNGSPSQQINAVKDAAEILKVRMNEMTDQVNTNLGKGIAPTKLLSPAAQKALDAIEATGTTTPSTIPAPAAAPAAAGGWTVKRID